MMKAPTIAPCQNALMPSKAEAVADDLDQRANDRRGDDLQFHPGARIGGDRAEPAGFDHASDPGGKRRCHIDGDLIEGKKVADPIFTGLDERTAAILDTCIQK
jgi:hypothetical protein